MRPSLLLALCAVCLVLTACAAPRVRDRSKPRADPAFGVETGAPASAPAGNDGATAGAPAVVEPEEVDEIERLDNPPEVSDARYLGPRVTAEILQLTAGGSTRYAVMAAAHVPSGGYELAFAGATTRGREMTLRLDLIAPGKRDIRTMALETLSVRHDTGSLAVDSVRVYVNLKPRDGSSTGYRLATTAP